LNQEIEEVRRVTSKRGISVFAQAGLVLLAAGLFLLAGCVSLDIPGALGKQIAPKPAPAPQSEPAPAPQNAPAQDQNQSRSSGGAAMAYQYQFGAFYSGFWNMGWFGYKDNSYKPGQGTIWKFTGTSRKPSESAMTFERALLKVNADSSQWWRFKMDTGKDSILYEFLVGTDSTVKKVRYKDPDSGTVGEFVPSQDRSQASAGPSNGPKTREEMAKYRVDKQNVKVQAGNFAADHYLYNDDAEKGSAEFWVSATVPGNMVKSIYTTKKDNQTSAVELMQIESGVTTTLSSY
jgi:hypothetical protein